MLWPPLYHVVVFQEKAINMSYQELINAKEQISVARTELKNIRMAMGVVQKLQKTYVKQIQGVVANCTDGKVVSPCKNFPKKQNQVNADEIGQSLEVKPIGFIHSAFKNKNATPRQPTICMLTTATLVLNKEFYTNPSHALDGLQDFSHIWLMFIFHKNDKSSYCKGKVSPPRLDGKRIGVFSTRSPHRPNPIGLSLARLIKVEGDTLHLSGIDVLDGTPVVDIKPYIPVYDQPNYRQEYVSNLQESTEGNNLASTHENDDLVFQNHTTGQSRSCEHNSFRTPDTDLPMALQLRATELTTAKNTDVTVPSWIDCPPVKQLGVHWTHRAMKGFCTAVGQHTTIECEQNETFRTVTSILKEDPRSVYRRHQCSDQLYYFTFDFLHLTCWFDDSDNSVEIVKVCRLQHTENKHE